MRKLTLTLIVLILFILISTSARASVNGWLWGGSQEISSASKNGWETGVGWISMNGDNYGVDIPKTQYQVS